jgi:hypothetical protein
MPHASKCSSITFWKIYLELLSCMVFKIFASLGPCDHVYSFMAIVHIVCLLANHEWNDASQVHNSQNSQSLTNALNYLCENPHSWNIIKSSVNEAYIEGFYSHRHDKSGKLKKESLWENLGRFSKIPLFETCPILMMEILQVQRRFKWKDIIITKTSQGKKWNGSQLEIS